MKTKERVMSQGEQGMELKKLEDQAYTLSIASGGNMVLLDHDFSPLKLILGFWYPEL